nr:hypothetical protein [Tanacetum cinerariifolium]
MFYTSSYTKGWMSFVKRSNTAPVFHSSTVSLNLPVLAASGDSGDSVDKLFDEADDVEQEHSFKRDDDVLEETIAKDVSEVAIEKTKSKRKRKATRDATLATIRSLVLKGSNVPSGIAEPQDDGFADFVSGLNLRTCPPSKRYVISSDDSYHSDSHSEVNFLARSTVADTPVRFENLENFRDVVSAGKANVNAASSSKLNEPTNLSDSFYVTQDFDSETLHNIYVPKWKVTNDFIIDNSYVFRDLTDHLASPAFFSQLRSMDYDQLYTEFNVGATRQICLGAESTIHSGSCGRCQEHELRNLKERNFTLEGEKDALSKKVKTLETVTASKETELASLTAQVAQLTFDLSGFQLLRDELSSKVTFL